MHIQVVLGFLVFATCYGFGNTCSCFPTTVEEKYCRADFVLKVRVRSALQNPSGEQNFDDYYRIKWVRAPWKFNFENFVLMKNRVYTASNGALCGVSLQKGQKYLISGTVDKNAGKMRIDYCTAIVYRTPVARSIKKLKLNPPNCEKLLAPVKIKEPTRRRK